MQNKEHALRGLLRDVFDISGLHQWVRLQLGKDIHDELPHGTSLSQAAFDVTMAIGRHGRADAGLFESLRNLRPHFAERIQEVAALWSIMLGSDGPGRPVVASRARMGAKYYLYISQTKVEMLYSQISPADLPVKQDSLIRRLQAVCDFVRQHEEVGTALEPRKYLFDTRSLRYGIVSDYASDLAFFGGPVGDTTIGLIGSSASMVGESHRAEANHSLFYYTLRFLNELLDTEAHRGGPHHHTFGEATAIALRSLPSHHYDLEFLAKTLHREDKIVIATPLYVAIAQ